MAPKRFTHSIFVCSPLRGSCRASLLLLALRLLGSETAFAQAPGTVTPQSARPATADSTSQFSEASRVQPSRNVFKINPLSLLAGGVSVFYERAITKHTSLVVGYGSVGKHFGFSNEIAQGSSLFRRGTIEVRHYWAGTAPGGFYTGPYLRVGQLRDSYYAKTDPTNGSWKLEQAVIIAPGLLAGYHLVQKHFALDGFAGLQAQVVNGSLQSSNQVVEGFISSVALRVGLTVGLPFR